MATAETREEGEAPTGDGEPPDALPVKKPRMHGFRAVYDRVRKLPAKAKEETRQRKATLTAMEKTRQRMATPTAMEKTRQRKAAPTAM